MTKTYTIAQNPKTDRFYVIVNGVAFTRRTYKTRDGAEWLVRCLEANDRGE